MSLFHFLTIALSVVSAAAVRGHEGTKSADHQGETQKGPSVGVARKEEAPGPISTPEGRATASAMQGKWKDRQHREVYTFDVVQDGSNLTVRDSKGNRQGKLTESSVRYFQGVVKGEEIRFGIRRKTSKLIPKTVLTIETRKTYGEKAVWKSNTASTKNIQRKFKPAPPARASWHPSLSNTDVAVGMSLLGKWRPSGPPKIGEKVGPALWEFELGPEGFLEVTVPGAPKASLLPTGVIFEGDFGLNFHRKFTRFTLSGHGQSLVGEQDSNIGYTIAYTFVRPVGAASTGVGAEAARAQDAAIPVAGDVQSLPADVHPPVANDIFGPITPAPARPTDDITVEPRADGTSIARGGSRAEHDIHVNGDVQGIGADVHHHIASDPVETQTPFLPFLKDEINVHAQAHGEPLLASEPVDEVGAVAHADGDSDVVSDPGQDTDDHPHPHDEVSTVGAASDEAIAEVDESVRSDEDLGDDDVGDTVHEGFAFGRTASNMNTAGSPIEDDAAAAGGQSMSKGEDAWAAQGDNIDGQAASADVAGSATADGSATGEATARGAATEGDAEGRNEGGAEDLDRELVEGADEEAQAGEEANDTYAEPQRNGAASVVVGSTLTASLIAACALAV